MDERFIQQNTHLNDVKGFAETDAELRHLNSLPLIYSFPLLERLPISSPGIYTLTGAHAVGKTMLLKKWMEKLLLEIPGNCVAYIPGEQIENYHDLEQSFKKQIELMPQDKIIYIIIDDITSIRDWEKGITPFASQLNQTVLMLAGAYKLLAKNTQQHFGEQNKNNFHLNPLSFQQTVLLKQSDNKPDTLFKEFDQYLTHGGYLSAINDIAIHGHITVKTFNSYSDWFRKQTIKLGKQERFLREILQAVIKHYNTPITWNTLAQELTIEHPKTIGDYFAMLEEMDIVFVQHALLENILKAAPKKARKLMFSDPFLFHVVQAWLVPAKNEEEQIKATLENPELCSKLVETCVITQFHRYYPTYYIKAEGEIDLAYVTDNQFWPIEITWASQMRAKDLKQILKYANGRILTKTKRSGIIEHIRTEPLPLALWQLEDANIE